LTLSTRIYTKLLQVPEGKVTTYGERVKSQMLVKEGIKIKDGKIVDFTKEKFYF